MWGDRAIRAADPHLDLPRAQRVVHLDLDLTEPGQVTAARGPHLLVIDRAPEGQPGIWTVRQIFNDPSGDHDWGIRAEVDLAASDEQAAAVIRVLDVGSM